MSDEMSSWKCETCRLINNHNHQICQACFMKKTIKSTHTSSTRTKVENRNKTSPTQPLSVSTETTIIPTISFYLSRQKSSMLVNAYLHLKMQITQILHSYETSLVRTICDYLLFKDGIDNFDKRNIGLHHTLNGNVITCNMIGSSSSFFSNLISAGIHNWLFKIKSEYCRNIFLGIHAEKGPNLQTGASFWKPEWGNTEIRGYAYWVARGYNGNYDEYGIKCKCNDNIEMFLDMNRLELRYKVNGTDLGVMCRVKERTYRAAVYTYWQDESVEFISYMYY